MRITSQRGFTGLDERANLKSDIGTAVYMQNFRVTEGGSLTRRNGIDTFYSLPEGEIKGFWCGNIDGLDAIFYAANMHLYSLAVYVVNPTPFDLGYIGDGECRMFKFNGMLYIMTDTNYWKTNGTELIHISGYAPLVAISCTPEGEGELFEKLNLISPYRRQRFSSDGVSTVYKLAEEDIDNIESVTVNGNYHDYSKFDPKEGTVTFLKPIEEGLNNVEIQYSKKIDDDSRKKIYRCTQVMIFGGNSDGRAFLWGHPKYPNYRFHSDLANGVPSVEYFPANAYTIIGKSKINCIVQQYDKQLIFNENEAYYSFCELRDDGLGNTVSSFPVYNLNSNKGCIFETEGCVIDNRPVTLCNDGLNMWESTSVQDERNAVCFSAALSETMKNIIAGDTTDLKIFDFQANRELFMINGDIAYVYNYDNGCWYVYDGFFGKYYAVWGTAIYFANGGTIYKYGYDIGKREDTTCIWESPYLNAGHTNGRCDVTKLEADLHVKGPIKIRFELQNSEDLKSHCREFEFNNGEDRYLRISLRPGLKRTMPFKLIYNETGSGSATLHGISITTRKKERSSRNGIL